MQFKTSLLLFFIVITTMVSCISNKKLLYLQDQRADLAPKNSPAKTFKLKEAEYRLKPADIISVEVFSLTQEKYNFLGTPKLELAVNTQGMIELPVVGNLKVSGLTLEETAEKLKNLTTEYLKNPKINVKLINFKFTVLGEVGNQGSFTSSNTKINILEALGMAGGLSDYADRAKIRIIRQEKENVNVFYVDLLEDNILLSENYFLQPNDLILVDPLKVKNVRQQQIGTLSLVISILTSITLVLTQVVK